MATQTLASAFAAALDRTAGTSPSPRKAPAPIAADESLLSALRHSATDLDQIVQRRIGMLEAALAATT
jgi:hypothetical protein